MILAFFIFVPVLLLALSAYGWRRKALQNAKQAQDMGLLAAHLEGQLTQAKTAAEKMTEIAKHAINEAAKATGTVIQWDGPKRSPEHAEDYSVQVRQYVSPVVAFCPSCNVSVRHDPSDYPVKCPREGCDTLIDPTFDSGVID